MRASRILAVSCLSALGISAQDASTNAPVVWGNPSGTALRATLPKEPFTSGSLEGNVEGYITAEAGPGGVGVTYGVHFSNLPSEGGPFTYHLHVDPVPADGNCTETLAHLDPYQRGEDPPCDASAPETCQVGDLAGKYGKITSDPFEASYYDPYSSLIEGDAAYFGNRSFVFHFANKTRISCASFARVEGGNGTYPTMPAGTGGMPGGPAPSETAAVPPISAANGLSAVKNYAVAPLIALLLVL